MTTTIKDPKVRNRIALERRIARAFIKAALAAGYSISVYDGEEFPLRKSTVVAKIMAAMFSTDEDYLYVHKGKEKAGWVRFIYGESGWDVICDYTTNLESLMVEPNKISNKAQL